MVAYAYIFLGLFTRSVSSLIICVHSFLSNHVLFEWFGEQAACEEAVGDCDRRLGDER